VKVFFDHNMSPAMARAFRELFRKEHEIKFLAEKFNPNTPDVEWITALSQEGQWAASFPAIGASPETARSISLFAIRI
jgi:hypothetical protein